MLYPNPQIYHHLKAIFVHVPKTAGTSIERHLRRSVGEVVGGHTTALAFRNRYPDCFDSYYKFAVVRNPMSRFLSAYRYLRAHPVHPALHNQVIHNHRSMNEFIETVRGSPAVLDRIVHLLPQHIFVCDQRGVVLVDDLFRFENLGSAWPAICERLGLPHRSLAKLNVSQPLLETMDDEGRLRALVSEIYARDLELFGWICDD